MNIVQFILELSAKENVFWYLAGFTHDHESSNKYHETSLFMLTLNDHVNVSYTIALSIQNSKIVRLRLSAWVHYFIIYFIIFIYFHFQLTYKNTKYFSNISTVKEEVERAKM